MQYITKLKLAAVHQMCDAKDKSTEYMLQFMQDSCKVDHDTVIEYIKLSEEEHKKLFIQVIDFLEVINQTDNIN